MSNEQSREQIVGPVLWRDLQAHAKRQGLFLVAVELDLLEAAEAIATDDTGRVQEWIQNGQFRRPSAEEIEAWAEDLDRPFRATVVQPFALAQLVSREGPNT